MGVLLTMTDERHQEELGERSNFNSFLFNSLLQFILSLPDRISEKDIVDNNKRFYCIDCSKFIEDEVVRYDSNEYPIVHHDDGHVHHQVIFQAGIQSLLELGISLREIAIYERAEMYGIPVEKLVQILGNVGGDL